MGSPRLPACSASTPVSLFQAGRSCGDATCRYGQFADFSLCPDGRGKTRCRFILLFCALRAAYSSGTQSTRTPNNDLAGWPAGLRQASNGRPDVASCSRGRKFPRSDARGHTPNLVFVNTLVCHYRLRQPDDRPTSGASSAPRKTSRPPVGAASSHAVSADFRRTSLLSSASERAFGRGPADQHRSRGGRTAEEERSSRRWHEGMDFRSIRFRRSSMQSPGSDPGFFGWAICGARTGPLAP